MCLFAGQEVIERGTYCVDIRTNIHLSPAELFRCSKRWGAENRTADSEFTFRTRQRRDRQTKVADLYNPLRRQETIRRFDVSVEHTDSVSRLQAVDHL